MTEENGYAEAWKPEPNDTITGVVKNAEMIDPNGKGAYPCVTVETAGGEQKAIHVFHAVLRNELARRKPKVGDEITVTYKGKVEGGQNGFYHSYSVSGGQASEVDWDMFLPAGERQSTPIPSAPVPVAAPVAAAPAASNGEQFGDVPF